MPILWLVACTRPYTHTETLTATEVLPELTEDCASDELDATGDDGNRVVGRVEPAGTGCRATVYAERRLTDWAAIRREIRSAAPSARVEWQAVRAGFERIGLTLPDGAVAPAGTAVELGQLVSRPGSSTQGEIDDDPLALADDLAEGALAGRSGYLVGFRHVLDESGGDLATEVDVEAARGPGPANLVNASWAGGDPELLLLTVATATVPSDVLAEIGGTVLSLEVAEEVVLDAEVAIHPL